MTFQPRSHEFIVAMLNRDYHALRPYMTLQMRMFVIDCISMYCGDYNLNSQCNFLIGDRCVLERTHNMWASLMNWWLDSIPQRLV